MCTSMVLVFVVTYFALVTIFLFVVEGVNLRDGVVMISLFMKIDFIHTSFITSIQYLIVVFPTDNVDFTFSKSSQLFHVI